jgi:UDP-glucose 4-epimerase
VRATQRLCNAVQEAAIQHFVHVSSIAVYDWSRIDGLLDENCPLVSIADAPTPYAASKLRQEQITAPLGEGRLRLTTIRPGFLWGSSRLWVDGVGRQLAAGYLLVSPQALVPLSYVENCADAVATIVERKTSGAFNVVDQLDISRARYLAEYIRGTGKRGFVIPISYQLGLTTVSALSRVFGDMLSLRSLPSLVDRSRFEAQFKPVTVKAEKIRRELGWYPPFDFAESAKRSFA